MYQPFRPLRKTRKRRPTLGMLRGGRNIGQPSQLVGAQQQVQRGGGRQTLGGGSSITTGPEQTPPEQQGLLGGILSAKGAYEGVNDAYEGGQKIQGKLSGLMDSDDVIALRNQFSDTYIPNSADYGAATDSVFGPSLGASNTAGGNVSGLSSTSTPAPYALPQNPNLTSLAGQQSSQIANQVSNLGSGVVPSGFRAGLQGAPQYTTGGTQLPAQSAAQSAQTAQGAQAAKATTGLQTGADAASGGSNVLGGAAAGLGVGLNAYDISQNGLNFGNATGLAGSAILAGTTMMGLANAWNPVGWALLAGSAAYSIFG